MYFKGRPVSSTILVITGILAFIINICSVSVVLCCIYMPNKISSSSSSYIRICVLSVSVQVVGNTTSGAYGYTIQNSVAFAYVPAELSTPGQQLQVELLGNRYQATILKQAPIKIEAMRSRSKRKAKMPEKSSVGYPDSVRWQHV